MEEEMADSTLRVTVSIAGSHTRAEVSELVEGEHYATYDDIADALDRFRSRALYGFFGYLRDGDDK